MRTTPKDAIAAVVIWGGCAAFLALGAYGLSWLVGTKRDPEQVEFADFCMEWRTKNQMGKLLDGPDMAKGCQYYLEHRSEADEADDARRWDKRLEAAHARWDAMANK